MFLKALFFSRNLEQIKRCPKWLCTKSGTRAQSTYQPLRGVRVLDLTRVLAGPYCTMILGDLGADIIKVEAPGSGDDTRSWGPPWIAPDHSAYFQSINRNKRSIAVNLKSREGQDIMKQLAMKSDVWIENYIPGKLAKMGLGYEQLRDTAPHLIYTSITGFGQTGPYAQRAGYDNIAAAVGGLMHITGPEDGEPCRVGVAMTDLSTGLYAYGAICTALMNREKTGRGQHIDCNLFNTQLATLTHIASNYLNCGVEAKRYGTGHPSIVPYQAFQTKDGRYVMVGAGNDRLFADVCQRLDLSEMVEDSRFASNALRVKNRKALIQTFSDRFKQKTAADWMKILEHGLCPCGPINSIQEAFEDPQAVHNGMIQEMEHPELGSIRIPGPAVKYSEGALGVQYPPPLLGEHTDHVLSTLLGYSQEDIINLRNKGAVQ